VNSALIDAEQKYKKHERPCLAATTIVENMQVIHDWEKGVARSTTPHYNKNRALETFL
jgi:hypothetical protein